MDRSTWEMLFRAGHVAKGVVYVLVGLFGVLAAVGGAQRAPDSRGVLEAIAAQPFGQILLGLVAVGLLGYVAWRGVQALSDPEHAGRRDAASLARRVGYGASAVVYLGLFLAAARMALGRGGGGGDPKQEWSAWLLSQPFGQVLLGLAGLAVVGVGLYEIYRVVTHSYLEEYDRGNVPADQIRRVKTVSDVGLSAHGVTLGAIGAFLVVAAVTSDPSQTRGLGETLTAFARTPLGPWLLGAVSVGLACYGVYCFFLASFKSFAVRGLPQG